MGFGVSRFVKAVIMFCLLLHLGTLSTMNSNKAFNSLSINKETGLILTGSSDPIIRLWDPRSRGDNIRVHCLKKILCVSLVTTFCKILY